MDLSERCRHRFGSELDHSIPVPRITPRKRAAMECTCSSQKKEVCSISMSILDEDSGLGMDIDQIPVPSITPRKRAAMECTCSSQKKEVCSISMSILDEDSGLGMDINREIFQTPNQLDMSILDEQSMDVPLTEFQSRPPSKKCFHSPNKGRRLFNNKRSLHQDENVSSTLKRFRDEGISPMLSSLTISTNLPISSDPTRVITDAVDRMTFESDLIADGSRTYSLPTVASNHKDLKCISSQTMVAVLRGEYTGINKIYNIFDCRYPYEFQAGHIKNAVNLYTKETMQQFLHQTFDESYDTQRRIIIIYCEFSSVRGPRMYRFLREQDRILNKDNYPQLCYPEVYLLDGGYKAFYENHKHYCEPTDYKPMSHKDHAVELRHFKAKSKSCSTYDNRHDRLRHKLIF